MPASANGPGWVPKAKASTASASTGSNRLHGGKALGQDRFTAAA
jgi:hypothetical protein